MTDPDLAAEPDDDSEDEEDGPPAPIDLERAFRNIVQVIQAKPANYKLFGIYWWPIKALLRGAGYGPHQLYMLGTYQDPETAGMVPTMNLQDTVRAALREYGFNARYPHLDGRAENESGELVAIVDDDAGF